MGLAFGALAGVLPAVARQIAPQRSNTVFGLLFGAFALGSFAGPAIGAQLDLMATFLFLGAGAGAGARGMGQGPEGTNRQHRGPGSVSRKRERPARAGLFCIFKMRYCCTAGA